MIVQPRQFNGAFFASVTLHVVVLLILIVSFEFSSQMVVVANVENDSKIISAVAVDMPSAPIVTHSPPPSLPAPLVPKVVKAEPPPPPSPEVMQKQHAVELLKQNTIALNEKKKKIAAEKAAQQAMLEKQLLADVKKQVTKEKIKKQKSLEQAMAKELKEQAEKSLQQELSHEDARAKGAKARGIVNKYQALILEAIGRRWLVPGGVDKKLSTKLMIRLAPGGMVLDVQVTRSSGDLALDRSARDAVFKASPLPVPTESSEFNQFRQFELKVKPENVTVM